MARLSLHRSFLLLGLWVQFFATSAAADPIQEQEAFLQAFFKKRAPSVVKVSLKKSFGTGFFVSDHGLILTNAHVVGDQEIVSVTLRNGTELRGKVIEKGRDGRDVALVKVDMEETPGLSIAGFDQMRVGSWAASIGHGEGAIWSFNTGMVSNIYRTGERSSFFQTQIPLNPGSSGGPIFNRNGQVIGIVVAGVVDANNLNFGIRGDAILDSLTQLEGSDDGCIKLIAPAGVPIFRNGQVVGKGPQQTYCKDLGNETFSAIIKGKMVQKTAADVAFGAITFE